MHKSLSPRLLACADFVSDSAVLLDIGTDHAYLPCYLIETGAVCHAYASDVADGPLESAYRTAEALDCKNKLTLLKSDGLKDIPDEILAKVTDVVIAGMGGELICDILSLHHRLNDGVNFILQPNTRAHILREFLYREGIEISEERAVFEGKRSYVVMKGKRGKARQAGDFDPLSFRVGMLDKSDLSARKHVLKEARQLEAAAAGMLGSADMGERGRAEAILGLAKKMRGWAGADF